MEETNLRGKCATCKFLGTVKYKEWDRASEQPLVMQLPACRRYAPKSTSTCSESIPATFPLIERPDLEWCGEWDE